MEKITSILVGYVFLGESYIIILLTSLCRVPTTYDGHMFYVSGEGDALDENWVFVEVNVDNFRTMGDPCFQLHFRLSKPTFEVCKLYFFLSIELLAWRLTDVFIYSYC